MTQTTKKYRIIAAILFVVCLLLNVGPLATYTIMGFAQSNLVVEKVALTATVFIVLIMTVYNLVTKVALRSRVWVLVLGLYFCLDAFLTPLLIIAVCQVLDELVFSPLRRHYRNKYTINREIDKRGI